MLKNSPKAVPTTKKGCIPFGKADLATIMQASVPMRWQNQYNLTHITVPRLTLAILPDLEAIKIEKQNVKLKTKGEAATA